MPQFNNIYTYENIQRLKLATVPDSLDKREGSVIWTTIAANSVEMAFAFEQMRINQDNAFPDTASREYLIRHCAIRGITPKPATYARVKGEFYSNVVSGELFNPDVGTRFTVQNTKVTYVVTKQISDGVWELVCETLGSIGNIPDGVLVPVHEIQALGNAKIVGIIDSGEDEEDTESLRSRYMESLDVQAFGGNKLAYKELAKSVENVGACKVHRAYGGRAGHVGLCILNSQYEVPNEEVVANAQRIIDPTQDGEGEGTAPIDHIVNLYPATELTINVSVKITPVNTATTWEHISIKVDNAIQDYFNTLKRDWEKSKNTIVRPSQILARLLDVDDVLDVTECLINGTTGNIMLDEDVIPKVGDIVGEIVYAA